MTFRQRSSGDRASVVAMWLAEAVRFAEVSGTSFGRDVVPEVCSSNAVSSGPGQDTSVRFGAEPASTKVKSPAVAPLRIRNTAIPHAEAASTAGPFAVSSTTIAWARKSVR